MIIRTNSVQTWKVPYFNSIGDKHVKNSIWLLLYLIAPLLINFRRFERVRIRTIYNYGAGVHNFAL